MSSRKKNVIKNIKYGFATQFVSYALSFITRTIFIRYFSIKYLGVNNLFTNILMLFSLVEGGVCVAYQSMLYEPLKNNDQNLICLLIKSLRRSFYIIAGIVGIVGVTLYPFLGWIIGNNDNIPYIELIYALFLIKTIISYCLISYQALLAADQKQYIFYYYSQICAIIQYIVQIIILRFTQNFILYMVIQTISGILVYILIMLKCNKMYPYILKKPIYKLSNMIQKNILERIKAGFLTNFSHIIMNGTDTIFITKFLGLSMAGIYSNYLMIIQLINVMTGVIYDSLTASVGNLLVEKDTELIYNNFKKLFLLNILITGFTSICLWILINPFIKIWLGEEYILPNLTVGIIVLLNAFGNFGIKKIIIIFKISSGLFIKDKYLNVLDGIVNIVLSLLFVKNLKIDGIFIASLIATTITLCSGIYILYKYLFNKKIFEVYLLIKDIIKLFFVLIITTAVCNVITVNNVFQLMQLFIVCILFTGISIMLFFYKNNEFRILVKICIDILKGEIHSGKS
jgi:hypothetical protein